MAAGLGLSLSLMFLGAGILLIAVAVVMALVGMGTTALMPRPMAFLPRPYPFCEEENQALVSVGGCWSDSRGAYMGTVLDYGTAEVRDSARPLGFPFPHLPGLCPVWSGA